MENQLDTESDTADPEPKIIGLTGGIGSGKSTVAKMIENLGYPVYYSDNRAKEIVNEKNDLKQKIIQLLGAEAYDDEGFYNRQFVGEKVFNNAELLQSLNQIIHPAVKNDFEEWLHHQTQEFIFKETALLFELKMQESCYKTLLVTADDNIRMKRVMDRDHKTYRQVEAIMENQMPEKDKIKKADYVICNNGSVEELNSEIEKVISEIISEEE